MSNELSNCLKALDRRHFDIDNTAVICWFGTKGSGRHHAVRLEEVADAIRMEATVATAKTLDSIAWYDDPHRWAWRRNKASTLVGFRIDGQQRLVAEAVAPKISLTQEEFVTYLRAVAAEADRMELVLTGRDVQ